MSDNIQGIADGGDIPSTAIRNCARAAIDRANQYLNAQALNPPSHEFEAGLRAALKYIDKIIALIDDENAAEPLDDAIEYASKAKAALAAIPRPATEESLSVEELADDMTDSIQEIREQNWKNGGALIVDSDEARLIVATTLIATFDIKKRSGI